MGFTAEPPDTWLWMHVKLCQRIKNEYLRNKTLGLLHLTGFVFFPLVPRGTAFVAVDDDGCVSVTRSECIQGGGASEAVTDLDVFCLLRAEVVRSDTGS